MRSISLLTVLALAGGCSSYDLAGRDASVDTAGYYDTGSAQAPSANDGGGTGGADTAPPENGDRYIPLLPAQTDAYVFIANPTRGTLTRVEVATRQVKTTPVGNDPRIVLTTPDYATAVAFNRGDDTVSLVDANSLESQTVPVRPHFNQMVMSPQGGWVALYHDIAAERPDDPPVDGIQSFNEVSLVNVDTGEHFPMAVRFNPRGVKFTADDSMAVVVSDAYLAVIDLTAQTPSPTLVRVADDLVNPPPAEEVAVTPNGAYAFVRQFGATDLVVVDLSTHDLSRLPVGANPTDLDLTPDGTKAVVISRDSGQVHVFDTSNPFLDPEVIDLPTDMTIGSVTIAPSGDKAILYSTAVLQDRYATWNLSTNEVTERSLVKPVAGVAVTPTGGSLMIFHTQDDPPDADQTPFTGHWALSLVDLADFRTNPLLLPAEPIGFANATSGQRGYMIMDGVDSLAVLDYRTLLADEITLHSDPVFVGVLPDLDLSDGNEPPAWVSQNHDLGRISFYDPDDDSVETLTGFELNSQIQD